MPRDVQQSLEPHDRLTRICDRLTVAFDNDPEVEESDKVIFFVSNDERSGIVTHRFQGEDWNSIINQEVSYLFMHLRAMFQSMGKDLLIAPIKQKDPDLN